MKRTNINFNIHCTGVINIYTLCSFLCSHDREKRQLFTCPDLFCDSLLVHQCSWTGSFHNSFHPSHPLWFWQKLLLYSHLSMRFSFISCILGKSLLVFIHFLCFQMYAYSILREPLLGYLCDAVASLVRNDKELSVRWEVSTFYFYII